MSTASQPGLVTPSARGPRSAPENGAILGVTLEQYAAVSTGIAAGFDQEDVLAAEAVDPAVWPEAGARWSEKVVEAVATGGPLTERYDRALADAQMRYGRTIRPLESDLAAWLAFEKELSTSADPAEMLHAAKLGLRDVLRLHRVWSARIEADPELAKRALALRRGPPGAVPALVVEVPVVEHVASRAALPTAAAGSSAASNDADTAPSLWVPLPGWADEGATESDHRRSDVALERPPRAPADSAPGPSLPSYLQRIAVSSAPSDLRATSAFIAPRGPAMPFRAGPAGAAPISAQPKPKVHRAPDELRGTSAFVAPRGPALPFARGDDPESPASSNAAGKNPPSPAPPTRGASADLRGTALAIDVPSIPLPFVPGAPSEGGRSEGKSLPDAAVRANAASPVKPGASPDLRGTALALDVPSAPLPFAGAAPPSSRNPAPSAPASRLSTGTSIALPPSGAPLPFAAESRSDTGAKPPQPTALTLEQYASLCAELAAARGEDTAAIRGRYGIPDEATWQAIDARWQAKFLFDGAARAKWLELTEQYRRWLVANR